MEARNSAEVAIKLYDVAHRLGIPAKIECSFVMNSDSRYLLLYPYSDREQVIRISSHKPPANNRYDLCLDVISPNRRASAVFVGTKWMEKIYVEGASEEAAGFSLAARVSDAGVGGDGPVLGGADDDPVGRERRSANRAFIRRTRKVRNAGEKPKWTSSEARRVRDQWDWND